MRQLLLVLVVAACGDNAPTMHDGAPPDASFDFGPGCYDVEQTSNEMFASPTDFGDIAPGSLAGWDFDGRWFLTGVRVRGVSSFHLRRQGADVIFDRDGMNPATLDDDKMFYRATFQDEDVTIIVAKRVANRLPDGTVRADRAVCDGTMCRVCAAKLIRAERFDPKPAENISLVGTFYNPTWGSGYTLNVRVAGNFAYLVRTDGLHIIDISNPTNPVERGKFKHAGDGYLNDVKIVDTATKRYALLADYPIDVVDVTNPDTPTLAAQIPEEAHTLFTETRAGVTIAYTGNYDAKTGVYDVTNPAAPVRLVRYQTNGALVHDLSVADGVAYLNTWDGGLQAVDFNNPAMPKLLGKWAPTPTKTSHSNWTTTAGGRKILLHGEETYGAHLDIVDNDPLSPTYMQPFATWKTRDWVSIHNIMAFGSKAYFTYYQDGVRIMDVADPAKPKLVGYYNTWEPQADYTSSAFFEGAIGIDVDLTNRLIYIADAHYGLMILHDDTP